MISLINISAAILQDIHLSINNQEFVMLLGNNGAGKSTLLHLLAGHVTPTKGRCLLNQEDITRLNGRTRARYIRYVPQNPKHGLCDALSIEENLLFAMQCERPSWRLAATASRRRKLQRLLNEVGLGFADRLQSTVAVLSGGEQQALSIIMATLTAPKILLLDEPTAALDPITAEKLLAFIRRIHQQYKLTVIMVTHRLEEVRVLGDRFVFLRQGKILHDVTANQLGDARRQVLGNFFAQCYV